MGYLGYKPADKPLTSADITDSIITSAKIVDGTITNADVASSIITGQTAETSIAGGDSILIYDDSATALRKMTRTNFVAGVGGNNTPAFEAKMSASQTLTSGTTTKITFNTENFDTNSNYDNSTNYRFTPTTAGKYFVYLMLQFQHSSTNNVQEVVGIIQKNGSASHEFSIGNYANYSFQILSTTVTAVIDFNGSTDYIEAFGRIWGNATLQVNGGVTCFFGAYKLIGV